MVTYYIPALHSITAAETMDRVSQMLVYKTPSEKDSLLIVFENGEVDYCKVGQYGGFICKPRDVDPVIAFYSAEPEIDEEVVSIEEAKQRQLPEEAKRLIEELGRAGFDRQLHIQRVRYTYVIADVTVKKRADHYMVIDITGKRGEAKAEALRLCMVHSWSRRGRGYDEENRKRFIMTAKLVGLEPYSSSCGRRCEEVCVKIVTDAKEVEEALRALRKALEPVEDEAEDEEAAAEATEAADTGVSVDLDLGELEIELEGVEEQKQPAETAAEAKEEEARPAAAAEEAQPRKQELVKVYFLRMMLPTPDLVAKFKWEKERQVRDYGSDDRVRAAVASRLNGLRREAYERIARHFVYVDEFGVWLAVDEDAVKHAEEVSKWIRAELMNMPALKNYLRRNDIEKRYGVKAIPVYLEPEHARELLEVAIKKLMSDIAELESKIEEAEKQRKKSTLRKYEKRLEYKKALLESLKRFLDKLG